MCEVYTDLNMKPLCVSLQLFSLKCDTFKIPLNDWSRSTKLNPTTCNQQLKCIKLKKDMGRGVT